MKPVIFLLSQLALTLMTAFASTTAFAALYFEENRGQFPQLGDFVAQSQDYTISVEDSGALIKLYRYDNIESGQQLTEQTSFRFELKNSLPSKSHAGKPAAAGGIRNYIGGEDRSTWITNVQTVERVSYPAVYPAIELVYYSNQNGLFEYDFVVTPGGNPADIQYNITGSDKTVLNNAGQLEVWLDDRHMTFEKPVAFQEVDGERRKVEVAYLLKNDTVAFHLGDYDKSLTLTIDPVLSYSSYYGGSGRDVPSGADVDSFDNIYVLARSTSPDIGTPGSYSPANQPRRQAETSAPSCDDCVEGESPSGQVSRTKVTINYEHLSITKFSPTGDSIAYTTYFPAGDSASSGVKANPGTNSFAVSPSGEAVFGLIDTPMGLPTRNPIHDNSNDSRYGYVAKLKSDGTDLVFATYVDLGPGNVFNVRGLDVGPSGETLVTGSVAFQNRLPDIKPITDKSCTDVRQFGDTRDDDAEGFADNFDGYALLLDSDGDILLSSCFGGTIRDGSSLEAARGAHIGDNGDLYIIGYTSMTDFPMVNPVQAQKSGPGQRDAFVMKVEPQQGTLLFSSYFGPTNLNKLYGGQNTFQVGFPIGVTSDSDGNIIFSSSSNELGWPAVNAFQPNHAGLSSSFNNAYPPGIGSGTDWDTVITKINPSTPTVVYSTYLGGTQSEDGLNALATAPNDDVLILQVTRSPDFPLVNPIKSSFTGKSAIALTRFTPAGAVSFSSLLSGRDDVLQQNPGGLAVNSRDQVVVVSSSNSNELSLVKANQKQRNGRRDMTIALLDFQADQDNDGDGVPNIVDAFPDNIGEWRDTDGDGVGNEQDNDDDGDGVNDDVDAFPLRSADSADDDNDGIANSLDLFDDNALENFDFDQDGIGDYSDDDMDGDTVLNDNDAAPLDPTESLDTDGDGIGDNADPDRDGDGIPNVYDPAPDDGFDPVITFTGFDPFDTNTNKAPLPDGFGFPSDWTIEIDDLTFETTLASKPIESGLATVDLTKTLSTDSKLHFFYRYEGIPSFDDFTLRITGPVNVNISLPAQSTLGIYTLPNNLPAGSYVFRWQFSKSSNGTGLDSAAIDNILFTSISNDDLDQDGLPDFVDPDTDGDGVDNFVEIAQGSNPLIAGDLDTDSDGISNSTDNDDDGDGINDLNEIAAGTNPLLKDSDNDGVNDNIDFFPLDENRSDSSYDIDGNGRITALTDGLLMLRYFFGLRGDDLITGIIVDGDCTRCSSLKIEEYIGEQLPPF